MEPNLMFSLAGGGPGCVPFGQLRSAALGPSFGGAGRPGAPVFDPAARREAGPGPVVFVIVFEPLEKTGPGQLPPLA